MATVKLVPGKPTVAIEGLSYEAAQAVKVWLYSSVTGDGKVKTELSGLLQALRDIKLPQTLAKLKLTFLAVEEDQEIGIIYY